MIIRNLLDEELKLHSGELYFVIPAGGTYELPDDKVGFVAKKSLQELVNEGSILIEGIE